MSQSFFRINGVLLPTPRSQVTIFNKHEKLFFEIAPCDSELNGRITTSWYKRCSKASFSVLSGFFTTSSLNGAQKLASALMSPTKSKMRSFFGCPYYLMQGSFFIISFRLNPFGYTRFSSKNVAIFSNGMMSVWSYRSVWDAPGMIMSSLLSPFSSLKASSPK